MTENELQQAYEELKSSYNYHDHRPQTRQGQEMLKQDEERFIDEALLPYIKQIVENFTNVLRNPITLRLTIPSNAGSIKAERITTKVHIPPKNTPTFPRRDASGLKIVLPDGKIIQEQSAHRFHVCSNPVRHIHLWNQYCSGFYGKILYYLRWRAVAKDRTSHSPFVQLKAYRK